MTVLVADDDAATRLMLRRVLRGRFGCEIVDAADGAIALGVLKTQDVDFVILDLQMPQVSGLDVLRVLRGSEGGAALPVIVLTAEKDAETVQAVLALGIADYLTKPLTIELVTARILKLFPELDTPARAAS